MTRPGRDAARPARRTAGALARVRRRSGGGVRLRGTLRPAPSTCPAGLRRRPAAGSGQQTASTTVHLLTGFLFFPSTHEQCQEALGWLAACKSSRRLAQAATGPDKASRGLHCARCRGCGAPVQRDRKMGGRGSRPMSQKQLEERRQVSRRCARGAAGAAERPRARPRRRGGPRRAPIPVCALPLRSPCVGGARARSQPLPPRPQAVTRARSSTPPSPQALAKRQRSRR